MPTQSQSFSTTNEKASSNIPPVEAGANADAEAIRDAQITDFMMA
jgi:hypothetical protein